MSVVDMPKTAEAEAADEEKGGGRKKLVLVAVVLAVLAGAGYWFFLKPKGEEPPEPGLVSKLDAIQINLADDHYLKVGIALQATTDAKEELDGSKALDETIRIFSGQSVDRLGRPEYREKLKKKLEHHLEEAYEGEVMGVYFTDFVTQ
jgi:flagellar protein FliL